MCSYIRIGLNLQNEEPVVEDLALLNLPLTIFMAQRELNESGRKICIVYMEMKQTKRSSEG